MIISHEKKFIFIHNYKVAGTSVRNALIKYNNRTFWKSSFSHKIKFLNGNFPKIYSKDFNHHIKAPALKEKLPAAIFDYYFKFGFVRNPWDWQVSLYKYMLQQKQHYQHEIALKFKGFDEYIDWRVHEDLHLQKEFFYLDDECLLDFIGKMENMDTDFEQITKKIKVESELPRNNATRPADDGFKKYYSQKSIDMVNEAFKEDIALFSYKKPIL